MEYQTSPYPFRAVGSINSKNNSTGKTIIAVIPLPLRRKRFETLSGIMKTNAPACRRLGRARGWPVGHVPRGKNAIDVIGEGGRDGFLRLLDRLRSE